MGSFLDFSRMTPRERMLAGLRGQLSPTFGLEVGSPRAQLGVIPLAGLGRGTLLSTREPPPDGSTLDTRQLVTTIATRPAEPVASIPRTPPPEPEPTPAPAPSGGTQPESRDDYEYDASSGKRVAQEDFDELEYSEEDPWGQAYGGDEDGEYSYADYGEAQAFDVDVERTRRIKSPATGAQMFWQKASPYLPWVLGGGALVGLAYILGKRK